MGLSKSKASKPGQTGFPNQQGFSSTPQMSNQSPFGGGGGFPGQPNAFGTSFGQPPSGGPQGFGTQPNAASGFGNQMGGFPPFPPQPATHHQPLTGGFPPSSLFPNQLLPPPPPLGPSSAYPISYQNQTFRPLIPGYAPAPGNDRRNQDNHHHHQEQGELSNRFYNDQMHSIPPMVHKSRKH